MKNRLPMRSLVAAVLVILLALCAGCGPDKPDESLENVLASGKLVLGLDASFPPMGFTDENGEIVGFDIDVAEEVCRRIGVTLVKQPINWETKEDSLNEGVIDCIWNGLSVSPARAESMNLSDPYMKNEMVFVVRGDSAIKAFADLSGKTVAVQTGSTAQELLAESKWSDSITTVTREDNIAMLNDLAQGKLDAVFLDSVVAYYYIAASDSSLYVLPGNLSEEKYAIGFRKDDAALRSKVQEILNEMKQDGTLSEIAVRWFGSDITTLK